MSKPSVILMGSKPGSVVALRALVDRGWDVRCVVPSQKVQHPWVQGPSLGEVATELGLKVVPQKKIPSGRVDFVISYMYRHLVKSNVIRLATRAALNFHAGPLPEFGGWAFYNIAILEGREEYGCTCHHMDEGFDTGPLLKVRRFPIVPTQHTAISLEREAQREMVRLFFDFLDLAEGGLPLPSEPQDPARMRYLKQEEFAKLKEIPAGADEESIDRTARAFWYPPYECAWTMVSGMRVQVVPEIAKQEIAQFYQADALDDLERVAVERIAKQNESVSD